MKLYMHPVSTTSRPVMQFIADNNIKCDMEVVDILKGQHYEPAYSKINPNHLIPMLEDGDFRLTESAAILRYLAEKIDSPAFPKDIKQRARVNEVMDWFNSNFYRDWGYGLIYPQLFPHLKREDAKVQEAVVAYGKEKSKIFAALLAKRFGIRPEGWEQATSPFSDDEPRSAADVHDPESFEQVRAWKKAMRAAGKAKDDQPA